MTERRRKFTPQVGVTYRKRGGGDYICRSKSYRNPYDAEMENVESGWRATAHGIGRYDDGRTDWDYSTGGRWTK